MSNPSSTEGSHHQSSENRTEDATLEKSVGVIRNGTTAEDGDKEAATETPPSPRKVHGFAVQTSQRKYRKYSL